MRNAVGWMVSILMLASVACDTGSTYEPVTERNGQTVEMQTAQGHLGLRGRKEASTAIELQAVKRDQTQGQDFSTSRVIGPLGGVIAGGGAQLVIPAGALDEDVEITLTVPAGDYMDVQFAPHGLHFRVPAMLSLSLLGTEAANNRELLSNLVGVYHTDDASDGTLMAEEIFGLRLFGLRAMFPIEHFSAYSTGYRRGFILVGA